MSKKQPVIFVGHGSPMNAIEDNIYTRGWQEIAKKISRPEAILVISAHWFTDKNVVNNLDSPRQIYDMYGFPAELYQLKYRPVGSPRLAEQIISLTQGKVQVDNSWGIDHGTWSVLTKMFPQADIPVLQLSVNGDISSYEAFSIGKDLSSLRDKNILIIGSGNIVHNLRLMDPGHLDDPFIWAQAFDDEIEKAILKRNFDKVTAYHSLSGSHLAVPYLDHFYPLLYILGLVTPKDKIEVFNKGYTFGSLSMTSYLFME